LNKDLLRQEWSAEETQVLYEAVCQFGSKNWQLIATFLNKRNPQQCLHRWRSVCLLKQNWTEEEDRKLFMATQSCGPRKWTLISKLLPGRSSSQCSERYNNCLHPDLSREMWSPEEDTLLKKLAVDMNFKWSKIAKEFGSRRTDNQCWRRWVYLVRGTEELYNYQESLLKKRLTLPHNYAGRRKDRPNLTPEDLFLPGEERRSIKRKLSSAELRRNIKRKLTHPEELREIQALDNLTLPFVLPSPVTYRVLGKLLCDLDTLPQHIQNVESNSSEQNSIPIVPNANSSSFQLMSAWFNSLFLFPTLVLQEGHFLSNKTSTDSPLNPEQ